MSINFSSFSTIMILAFLALCVAFPVKVSATLVGTAHNSLTRSFFSVFLPLIITLVIANILYIAIILFPFILFLSIKFLMGTSFIGAFGVTVFATTIYYYVLTNFFAGISFVQN